MVWRGLHYWFGDSVRGHIEVDALPPDVVHRIEERTRARQFPVAGRFRVADDERVARTSYRVGERPDTVRIVSTSPFAMLEDVRLRFIGTTGVDVEVHFPRLRRRLLALISFGVLAASALAVVLAMLGVPLAFALLAGTLLAAQGAIFGVAPLWAAQSSSLATVERAVRELDRAEEEVRVAVPTRVAAPTQEEEAEQDEEVAEKASRAR